jgi:ATP-dependent DNA helicase RecG
MQANGSPPAEFDFDEDHSYFMVRLPVHPAALEVADSEVGESADVDTPQVSRLLEVLIRDMSRAELMSALALKDRMHFANDYLRPALEADLIQYTIPDKPNSRLQQY